MGKRILSLLLTLCLLTAIVPSADVFAASEAEKQTVVYVPLDDRPFNDDRVRVMADSLNMELVMPDEDLYATKLDGQPLNRGGTQYGNREALLSWLREMDETHDTFILSLDQLLSGGLMNSRCMAEFSPLKFDDGSTMTEYEVIDYLAELAQNNQLYLVDSVVRLATSCDYGGYNLAHYNIFRTYGAVGRPILTGQELTVENILANYAFASDGHTPAYRRANLTPQEIDVLLSPIGDSQNLVVSDAMEAAYLQREDPAEYEEVMSVTGGSIAAPVTEAEDSMLSTYLGVRARKLRLTDYAMRNLCGKENVHYLLGIDDSSKGNNIQKNEVSLFSTHLAGPDDQIFSALDGLGQLALSKLFFSAHPARLRAAVTYLGEATDEVLSYNCFTTRESLEQTLDYYNAELVQDNPDLSVAVITPSYTRQAAEQNLIKLVSLLNENEAHGLPTILVDLTEGQEPLLNDALLENTHLGMLLSYSGNAEIPNGVIMALSQGLSRYLSLTVPDFQTSQTQQAHILNLSSALIKEFGFMDGAAGTMMKKLTALGINPRNFGDIDQSMQETIFSTLTKYVSECSEPLLKNLSSSNFVTGLSPYTTGSIQSVSIDSCHYPWLRHLEIGCDLSGSWSESPNPLSVFHQSYINGITDTTFVPDACITRGQTAKLLISAAGLSVNGDLPECPQDVAPWAWPFVSLAMERGYIKGYPDGSFRSENNITRAEFVTMVMQYIRAEGIPLKSQKTVQFSDVPNSDASWYSRNVYILAQADIIRGYPDGSFRPEENISRIEAVTLFNRLFHRTELLPDSILHLKNFSDVTADWHIPQVQEGCISHFCSLTER